MDELEVGSTVEVEQTLPQVEAEPKQEEVKAPEVETVEETIAKAKAELQAKAEPEEETQKVETKVDPKLEQKPVKQPKESYQPPQDWTAESKEEFRKLPKIAQKEITRIASQYEKHRKQFINEYGEKERTLAAKTKEIDSMLTTVQRFLPVWGRQGLTPEAALAEICTFYADLLKDPDSALEGVAQKVGRKIQIEGRKKQEEQNPLLQQVLERVTNIENSTNSSRQAVARQETQQLIGTIDQAFESLKEQLNNQEKYMYPDLHDESFVKNDLEPLVIGLAKAKPELSWEENIKRSYIAAQGRLLPNAIPTTTKLNGNRAARAATSIAGMGSGALPGEIEFIPNESVEDTVRRTVASMRSR